MKFKALLQKIKGNLGKKSLILLAVFAVLLTADLVLKYCEVKYHWEFTVIPSLITVQYGQKNTGAAFSFLADTQWGRAILITISVIMFIALVIFFLCLPERFFVLKLAVVMIASGALGNLVDRIALGYVRDFVWMNIFGFWACCNFADFWVVLGVILAVVDVLFFNEWAILPFTKGAKARVKARADREAAEKETEKEPETTPSEDGDNGNE